MSSAAVVICALRVNFIVLVPDHYLSFVTSHNTNRRRMLTFKEKGNSAYGIIGSVNVNKLQIGT